MLIVIDEKYGKPKYKNKFNLVWESIISFKNVIWGLGIIQFTKINSKKYVTTKVINRTIKSRDNLKICLQMNQQIKKEINRLSGRITHVIPRTAPILSVVRTKTIAQMIISKAINLIKNSLIGCLVKYISNYVFG
jgi:hypothetical protein